jgi:hypothetical protein
MAVLITSGDGLESPQKDKRPGIRVETGPLQHTLTKEHAGIPTAAAKPVN